MAAVLEEKDAIHETIANYCFYFDSGVFDKWVDLFTDDGVWDGGALGVHKGKDALRAFLKIVPHTIKTSATIPRTKTIMSNRLLVSIPTSRKLPVF